MGGDQAPQVVLEGFLRALPMLKEETRIQLIGPEEHIGSFLADHSVDDDRVRVIHAPEHIGMEEHPVKALQQKQNSTLNIGFHLLAKGELQSFASAGNSGAVMVAAMNALGTIEGIDRPCAVSAFPLPGGSHNILLDVGINVDVRPHQFAQFAKLGGIYAREVYGIREPRIGLLNTGAEESKGNILYQKGHAVLKNLKEFTFVGNIEARDFYEGLADVTVCDGFTGNIFLKQAEGFYSLIKQRSVQDSFLEKFNYERYGGTPILGLNGNVLLGHGISGPEAIKNMIFAGEKVAEVKLSEKIQKTFNK